MANDAQVNAAPNFITAKRIAAGFVAGFISVLIFHQIMLAILYAIGFVGAAPYSMAATAPLGIPAVLSAAFWGGIWGIVFVLVEPWFPRDGNYWIAAIVFGAIPLSLVAWFVVAPLKGAPVAAGGDISGLITALLVNGAWGVGTALFLRGMTRHRWA